jgi:large subunit ribosomal protein L18
MKNIKIKSDIVGTKGRPRVSVYKSNKYTFVQLIDDQNQKTLLSGSDKGIKVSKEAVDKDVVGGKKVSKAFALGVKLAKKAKRKKITEVVFDRGEYRYHGRVKALADGLRKGGLKL